MNSLLTLFPTSLLILFFLSTEESGCNFNEEKIYFNRDGTVKITYTYEISKKILGKSLFSHIEKKSPQDSMHILDSILHLFYVPSQRLIQKMPGIKMYDASYIFKSDTIFLTTTATLNRIEDLPKYHQSIWNNSGAIGSRVGTCIDSECYFSLSVEKVFPQTKIVFHPPINSPIIFPDTNNMKKPLSFPLEDKREFKKLHIKLMGEMNITDSLGISTQVPRGIDWSIDVLKLYTKSREFPERVVFSIDQ